MGKRIDWEFNGSAISRLWIRSWWLDEDAHWVTCSWGTAYGDPVWSFSIRLPRWITRWIR